MTGQWMEVWPKRDGVYWALAPDELEPVLVAIKGERWEYQERDWELAAPTLFWTEQLRPPSSPDGFRLKSADHATWTQLWPEVDGLYWLYHPDRPIGLAQVTNLFRGYIGTEDAWEREESFPGELFWSEPIFPPAPPKERVF
jgi:Uma2 family endonuclease